jgi:hypothetical protein
MKKYKCTHLRMLKHDKNKLALTVYKTVAWERSRNTQNDKIVEDLVNWNFKWNWVMKKQV